MPTFATADREDTCTWTTNRQALPNVQITARQQNGSTQTRVKRDRASCGSHIDGIAQRPWPVVIEIGDSHCLLNIGDSHCFSNIGDRPLEPSKGAKSQRNDDGAAYATEDDASNKS